MRPRRPAVLVALLLAGCGGGARLDAPPEGWRLHVVKDRVALFAPEGFAPLEREAFRRRLPAVAYPDLALADPAAEAVVAVHDTGTRVPGLRVERLLENTVRRIEAEHPAARILERGLHRTGDGELALVAYRDPASPAWYHTILLTGVIDGSLWTVGIHLTRTGERTLLDEARRIARSVTASLPEPPPRAAAEPFPAP